MRNEATYVQWQAGVTDRRAFGQPDKTPHVQVSIQQLHLAALQASGGPEHLKLPEAPTDMPRLEPGDTFEDQDTGTEVKG